MLVWCAEWVRCEGDAIERETWMDTYFKSKNKNKIKIKKEADTSRARKRKRSGEEEKRYSRRGTCRRRGTCKRRGPCKRRGIYKRRDTPDSVCRRHLLTCSRLPTNDGSTTTSQTSSSHFTHLNSMSWHGRIYTVSTTLTCVYCYLL